MLHKPFTGSDDAAMMLIMNNRLLTLTRKGLYCAAGDFYIDPTRKVSRAVITHAHSDHARPGSESYLTASSGKLVLAARIGQASIDTLQYGERRNINGVTVSFHPAGHVLGSAQVRLEHRGEIWVVSGDYKVHPDPTCDPIEPLKCHTFITESTFGLPIYRWPDPAEISAQINSWWQLNKELGKVSVLAAYSFGKAQRILAGLDTSIGPIFVGKEIEKLNEAYQKSGVRLPAAIGLAKTKSPVLPGTMLLVAPSSKRGWLGRGHNVSYAFVSGWTRLQNHRGNQGQGFVLSDHADWDGLLSVITATEASEILVFHGYGDALVRYLNDSGKNAHIARNVIAAREEPASQKRRSSRRRTAESDPVLAGAD